MGDRGRKQTLGSPRELLSDRLEGAFPVEEGGRGDKDRASFFHPWMAISSFTFMLISIS